MLDISLLGTSGMMPLPDRWLTSMLARYEGRMVLVDCGEGTQITLKLQGWGFKGIELICLTHYHADHISGLPGMLLAIGNSGRTEPITIMGPAGLKFVVNSLRVIAPELPFEINYIEIPNEQATYDMNGYNISTIPVEHMIQCVAYKIDIARKGKFDVEKANSLDIPQKFWSTLQDGNNVEYQNKLYTPNMVLGEPRKGLKVTYCTDTRPIKEIETFANNSDLFICEGMYGEDDKKEKAIKKKHMIFSEAAELAKNARVKELWLTHFSPSLIMPNDFLNVAKNIFANTIVGYDRITKNLHFES